MVAELARPRVADTHHARQGSAHNVTLQPETILPLTDLDEYRMILWQQVTENFVATDHFRKCDAGVIQAYVDSVANYLRVRQTLEDADHAGMTVIELGRLTHMLDRQSRLMAQMARELGFGPLGRRHMGTMVPEGTKPLATIEAFTISATGRR